MVLSGADTQGSVDARDEFPRISEHSSQLGKLHTTGGGGKLSTGGGTLAEGVICVCTGVCSVCHVCVFEGGRQPVPPKHGCDIMRQFRCTAGGLACLHGAPD